MRDSETSIDFVQGPPGSRRERVNRNPCLPQQQTHANSTWNITKLTNNEIAQNVALRD